MRAGQLRLDLPEAGFELAPDQGQGGDAQARLRGSAVLYQRASGGCEFAKLEEGLVRRGLPGE